MRKAIIKRTTRETKIEIKVNLDGKGCFNIKTPIGFLTHMLELFSLHSVFDLNVKAKGDIDVDYHHLVEDIGIGLGMAIKQALKNKKGINRYGFFILPMDNTLVEVSLDISNRPLLVYNVKFKSPYRKKDFDFDLIEEFFKALVNNLGLTLHINLKYGKGNHHISEAIFKCFARALRSAVEINPKVKSIPSTKKTL